MAKKFIILDKYLDYANILLKKLIAKFFKYFNINKHVIILKPGKKLFIAQFIS